MQEMSERSPGEGNDNVFQYSCLEKSHRQRSLEGFTPWDRKESDTTEDTQMILLPSVAFHIDKVHVFFFVPGNCKCLEVMASYQVSVQVKIPLGFIYSLESIVLVVKPSSISLKEFLTIMSGKISHFILILYYVFLKHIHTHLFILFIYHKLKQKQNTLCVSFYTCVSAGIGLEFSKMHQVRVFSLGKMINARDVFLNKLKFFLILISIGVSHKNF